MRTPIRIEYRAKPSLLAFMSNAFRPSHRSPRDGPLPEIEARWFGQRSTPRDLADFFDLSGLPANEHLSILYPHTVSFPMLMAVLSHPTFPFPIWNVLQVRNRLCLLYTSDAADDLTRVDLGGRRII